MLYKCHSFWVIPLSSVFSRYDNCLVVVIACLLIVKHKLLTLHVAVVALSEFLDLHNGKSCGEGLLGGRLASTFLFFNYFSCVSPVVKSRVTVCCPASIRVFVWYRNL